jgi:hypothetical protein
MPRPALQPTDEQRKLAKSLAAYGMRQGDIARLLSIRSAKTLRKHFRRELDQGEREGYAKVQQTLFQMATEGKNLQATLGWLQRYERRHGITSDQGPASPPTFIVLPEQGEPT